jgi:hypothetical protein
MKKRTTTIKFHAAGTAPDTSLHLGVERRAWLKDHGGIQPMINALIDAAMSSPYPIAFEPSELECEPATEGGKVEGKKEG